MKKVILFLLILTSLFLNIFNINSQETTQVVGKGVSSSNLIFPTGIYYAFNKVFISNYYGNTITIYDLPTGIYQEFGCFGSEKEKLNHPNSLLVTTNEKIVVIDSGNNAVKVFDFMGNFEFSFGENVLHAPVDLDLFGGFFYITDYEDSKIYIFDTTNFNLYDSFGSRGTNPKEFNGLLGIFIDNNGYIYACDSENKRVQIFDINFNFIKAINISGKPSDVFVDRDGKIYVSDYDTLKIHVFDRMGVSKIKEIKLNTDADWFFFKAIPSIFITEDNYLMYSIPWENRVEIIDENGKLIRVIGEEDKVGNLCYPISISISNDKRIFIVDNMSNSVNIYNQNGSFLNKINYAFEHPNKIFIDENDNIYVISRYLGEIVCFDKNLNFKFKIKNFSNSDSFYFPYDIFIKNDKIYVVDTLKDRIVIFSRDGKFLSSYGSNERNYLALDKPISIFIDEDNSIFILNYGDKTINYYDSSFNLITSYKDSNLKSPSSIQKYLDYLFISDDEKNKIYVYRLNNNKIEFLKTFGETGGPHHHFCTLRKTIDNYNFETEKFLGISDIYIKENHLYVVDSFNRRVQIVDINKIIGNSYKKFVITLWIDKPKALINEKEVYIDPQNPKVVPFVVPPGRTVVPIRFISESFGAQVTWEGDTKTIRIYLNSKNIKITLQVGNKIARVNDKIITLDAAPLIKEGRTFVPLRFISESFGADVKWFGEEKKIVIEFTP